MRKLIFVAIVLTIVPSFLVFASEYEVKGKAGGYDMTVRIDKNPPSRGYNDMDVVITDAAAQPVTDAEVHVQYLMPSFPGRAPMMEYSTTAKPKGNHYLARIDLSMAGEWAIVLKVTRAGKTETMEFTFFVK